MSEPRRADRVWCHSMPSSKPIMSTPNTNMSVTGIETWSVSTGRTPAAR